MFEQVFGKVHVFYPETTPKCCTAALLLDIDPIGLVRNRRGPSGEGYALEPYVNDRPYAASSFLSVAIARTFGTAITRKSKERQELADSPLQLEAQITVLTCRGGEGLLHCLFEPLGYQVSAKRHALDEKFPEWGRGYTRTGRRFFDDARIGKEFLGEVRGAVGAAGFWEQFQTDWIFLDAELMPWSAKAQELLRQQYAAVGAAARASLTETVTMSEHLSTANGVAQPLFEFNKIRLEAANRYVDSYRHYCRSVGDLKLAPFHLLATEGQVHAQQNHVMAHGKAPPDLQDE